MSKLKIVPLDDLHMEFHPYEDDLPDGDVLLLAGDIFVGNDLIDGETINIFSLRRRKRIHDFFDRASLKYELILMTPGNHEFYHGEVSLVKQAIRGLEEMYPNFRLLDNESVMFRGVKFIGTTLWSSFNQKDPMSMKHCRLAMSDYRVISLGGRLITPEDTFGWHQEAVEYLKNETIGDEPKVIMSHMGPSPLSIHPTYANDHLMNGAFVSQLEYLMKPDILLWAHGHVHNSFDYVVNGTRVVTNPRGYIQGGVAENPTFNPELVIELDIEG